MDPLSKLITQGSPAALNLVKSLLNRPMLINLGKIGGMEGQGLPFAIPLETEDHSQDGSAQVSESLLITKDQKTNVADNVAPGPWEWNMSGYIPGIPLLEPTNFFTPFVTLNTNLLKLAFKKGYVLVFKDIDAEIYTYTVIKSLSIKTQADCRNATPFRMTLRELNLLSVTNSNKSETAAKSFPSDGQIIGGVLKVGSTVAGAVTAGPKILTAIGG